MKKLPVCLSVNFSSFSHVISETSEHVVVLHWFLDHLHSLSPHCHHALKRIQLIHLELEELNIFLHLSIPGAMIIFICCNLPDLTIPEIPDKFEESDESSSSAHPRTAVNQHGSFRHLGQIILRLVLEVQHQLGVSRDLLVSPSLAVQLLDSFYLTCVVVMEL